MYPFTIKDLRTDERPREMLISKGSRAISDTDLVAILLSSGGKKTSVIEIAHRVLNHVGDLKGLLLASFEELQSIEGIGTAKACALKAAAEIGARIEATPNQTAISISDPQDAVKLVKADLFGRSREMLYLLSLNSRNKLISKDLLSEGTINETLIDAKEIFGTALRKHANYIILVHNHPSNDASPSTEDIKATNRIAEIGGYMSLPLLDHIIYCDSGFVSMQASRMIQPSKGGDKYD